MSQMHPLMAYLKASNEALPAFADRIGANAKEVSEIVRGVVAPGITLARKIAAATGDAVTVEQLYSQSEQACANNIVIDAFCRTPFETLDVERLEATLLQVAIKKNGVEIRDPEKAAIALAAEAVVHTFEALAGITTRRGPDRLQQALLPVLEETLKDYSGRAPDQNRLREAAAEIARLYYQS